MGEGFLMREEHGAVMVTVILWLPLVVLLPIFVIDVGNWFGHHRHLQTQADAAALAAVGNLATSFGATTCDDGAVEQTARDYSGTESGGYNHQLGGSSPDDVHFELNSQTYYNQASPVDDTVDTASPCQSGMIDVKLTETDLPLFFRAAGLFTSVPFINSHARVELFQKNRFADSLPIAVPDPEPNKVKITFLDEANGNAVLGTRDLARDGTSNGLSIWDNATNPLALPVNTSRIGVRVALSGGSTTNCGDPFVSCFDQQLFMRGYSTSGSGAPPNPPQARNVYLSPGTCADPYFQASGASCTVVAHADLDFGPCPANHQLPSVGASITAHVGGTGAPLTFQTGSCNGSTSQWASAPVSVASAAGPVPVTLDWREANTPQKITGANCGNKKSPPFDCSGQFEGGQPVQRTFSGSTAQGNSLNGPIRMAQLWEGNSVWVNSVPRGSTHGVSVKIGLSQSLIQDASAPSAPLVHLAVIGNQGQKVDCDPALSNLEDELGQGCAPDYERISPSGQCPATSTTLWASPQPWQCVAIATGNATGQVRHGMNYRIQGDRNANSCLSPNHWSNFPDLSPGDPRLVNVFLTPFGSFNSTGSGTVPVTNFATFYVSGYDHSPCSGDDPAGQDEIVGHFIKYIDTLNNGDGGTQPCDKTELGACVAVLTQ
jgi:hypothetical protein